MIKLEELTLKKIALKLKDEYPNSCMSHNIGYLLNDMEDDNPCILEELVELFNYGILGLCGCGDTNSVIAEIVKYLQLLYDYAKAVDETNGETDIPSTIRSNTLEKYFGVQYITDYPLLAYMAYDLDDRDLTDHGSSINGVWITDLGIYCLFVYKEYLDDTGFYKDNSPEKNELIWKRAEFNDKIVYNLECPICKKELTAEPIKNLECVEFNCCKCGIKISQKYILQGEEIND